MEAPEQEGCGHHQTMRRFQCPSACGEQHKCTQDVAEAVWSLREEECPQEDVFDEKDSQTEVQRRREHSRAHKHIHGVCEPTCDNQVSP